MSVFGWTNGLRISKQALEILKPCLSKCIKNMNACLEFYFLKCLAYKFKVLYTCPHVMFRVQGVANKTAFNRSLNEPFFTTVTNLQNMILILENFIEICLKH